jgi:energy-coupling factor transport system permease protein
MNAILAGEDIANAMDLRCFGLKKRTWVEALKFHWPDFVLVGAASAIFIGSLLLRFVYHIGNFWIPS